MFNKLVKTKILMILPIAASLVLTGCEDEEITAPATEQVDLSQAEDLFAQPVQPNPLTSDPEAVIIRVNGEDITRGEVISAANIAMQQLAGRVQPQQLQQMQGQIYQRIKDELISTKLMTAAVKAANVEVSAEEIAKTLEEIRGQVPEGETLESALIAQGSSIETLNKDIKSQLAARKFLESKVEGIGGVTPAEAKEFYDSNPDQFKSPENVSAGHILIKFDDGDTDEVKAEKKTQLEKIRADIIAGTVTFEDAATTHSGCPSSAQGGTLPPFGKGQMVPEFEVTAFSQEIGETGDVIETQFGYHIIKVSDHQEEGVVGYDEAEEKIITYLDGQKKQQVVTDFMKSLRDSATIEELAQ